MNTYTQTYMNYMCIIFYVGCLRIDYKIMKQLPCIETENVLLQDFNLFIITNKLRTIFSATPICVLFI